MQPQEPPADRLLSIGGGGFASNHKHERFSHQQPSPQKSEMSQSIHSVGSKAASEEATIRTVPGLAINDCGSSAVESSSGNGAPPSLARCCHLTRC